MIATNIGTNELNHLTFAGMDTVDLAKEYGTPVYLMDEARIRENVRTYRKALDDYFEDPFFKVNDEDIKENIKCK